MCRVFHGTLHIVMPALSLLYYYKQLNNKQMETEFSKGKWICNKSIAPLTGIEGEIEISTTDKTVVEWIALCHDSANAQLISAAPDLLNSLNDILIYCRSNSTSQLEPLIRNAEIAIKKATVSESF